MLTYSIKDLEKLSGIRAHTIRIWEKRYNLILPKRTETNIRVYSDHDLRKLINVSILNRNGFKISQIAEMSDEEISEKISAFSFSSAPEDQLESLTLSMLEFDEHKFEKILTRVIMQLGFEDAIIQLIYPFYNKVRVLWQTGTINHAQENFIFSLIRQKLIVALDSLIVNVRDDHRTFCLFLPKGEVNELDLLFKAYIIRKRGHKVIYLGGSQAIEEMAKLDVIFKSDYIVTSITSLLSDDLLELSRRLSKAFPDQKIYISGRYNNECLNNIPEAQIPDNIKYLTNPNRLIEEIQYL
jgi:DNA-binding transcriptional MerR regulator